MALLRSSRSESVCVIRAGVFAENCNLKFRCLDIAFGHDKQINEKPILRKLFKIQKFQAFTNSRKICGTLDAAFGLDVVTPAKLKRRIRQVLKIWSSILIECELLSLSFSLSLSVVLPSDCTVCKAKPCHQHTTWTLWISHCGSYQWIILSISEYQLFSEYLET